MYSKSKFTFSELWKVLELMHVLYRSSQETLEGTGRWLPTFTYKYPSTILIIIYGYVMRNTDLLKID